MNGDPLLNQLRQFADKLARKNISLVIGGGYGLLLKANHIQRTSARTRLEQIPIARIDRRYRCVSPYRSDH